MLLEWIELSTRALIMLHVLLTKICCVKKEVKGYPSFFGPMFLHWDGSFESYHYFFTHISELVLPVNLETLSCKFEIVLR